VRIPLSAGSEIDPLPCPFFTVEFTPRPWRTDMETWTLLRWAVSIAAGVAVLYGLHRLGLWMEDRGLIYYLRKKPRGGGSLGSFVALQKVIEPRAEHVLRTPRAFHKVDQGAGQGTDPAGPEDEAAKGRKAGPP
jgi:hypothetical protein